MANFCDNCGAKLDANSKFCPSCGTAINNGEAVLTTVDTLPTENSNLPVGKTISESGLVLHSSAPISRTCSWVRWLYILFAILVCAGGLGVIGLMLTFAFDCYAKDFHRGKMRRMRFKFVTPISLDEIYNKLQPVLVSKYGNEMEFDREGDTLCVKYKSVIYDINLHDDGTFSLWWRKSIAGALFSFNEWKLYNKIRTGTAIIAYELQQQFGIH